MNQQTAIASKEVAPGVWAQDRGQSSLTIEIAPGIEAPRYIAPRAIAFDGKPDGVDVWVTVRCGEDGPSCVELQMFGTGDAITGEVIRAVPVAKVVRGLVWRSLLRAPSGRRKRYTRYVPPTLDESSIEADEALQAVADIYRVAAYVGDAPRIAVQMALGLTQATAGRRIRAARAAGLLDVEARATGRGGRIYQGA